MDKLTVVSLMDVIAELFSDEISIAVSNETHYIYYRPSKRIDLKIKPGDKVIEGSLAYKALQAKQKVSEFIQRDVFGVPYHGMAVPFEIKENKYGIVTAIYPAMTEGKSVITVKTPDGWRPLPFEQVKFLEVKNRKTYVHGADGYTGIHKYSLQEFEYILPREMFIRCHRSFIVNVHYIKDIYPDSHSTFVLNMGEGTQINVSQSYSSYFRKLLGF